MLPARVQAYLDAVVRTGIPGIILFGSAGLGGWTDGISDVDLILLLPDAATRDEIRAFRQQIDALEVEHGFRSPEPARGLERFLELVVPNHMSHLVCTRADLLSGDIQRIFGICSTLFVDCVVLANIAQSGRTLLFEDLLPSIPLLPLRRLDVCKAAFGILGQVWTALVLYPVLPNATTRAMTALKASLHHCYFCYARRRALLEEEAAYFQRRFGTLRVLDELIALRRNPGGSCGFVARAWIAVLRLHGRTARDLILEPSTKHRSENSLR